MHSISEFLTQALADGQNQVNLWQISLAMLVAYLGGILSSLTPCVYPMIPITVSVVGGMGSHLSKKPSWKEIYFRALAYVLGMTVIYSFLGVLAGISGRVFGSFTQHSSWYLGLGLVMSAAALVMLEIIPFDPVIWWHQIQAKLNRHRRKSHGHAQGSTHHSHAADALAEKEITLLGAFVLGASSGFIAAPCTTPVLTSILAYIAKTRSVGLGFCLMFSFSLGLGTLLLLIASFAGAVQILPRSGRWMKTVKIGSGLILLAFADYLIYLAGTAGGT